MQQAANSYVYVRILVENTLRKELKLETVCDEKTVYVFCCKDICLKQLALAHPGPKLLWKHQHSPDAPRCQSRLLAAQLTELTSYI